MALPQTRSSPLFIALRTPSLRASLPHSGKRIKNACTLRLSATAQRPLNDASPLADYHPLPLPRCKNWEVSTSGSFKAEHPAWRRRRREGGRGNSRK